MGSAAILGMIATTIAGAVIQGVSSGVENYKRTEAYKNAAQNVRNATERYTSFDDRVNAGMNNIRDNNAQRLEAQAGKVSGPTAATSARLGSENITNSSNALGDFNTGASNNASIANARYNNATANAQLMKNQADVDYNVNTQAVASGLDALGDAISTGKQISDENEKYEPNNKSGLPHATIQDSLRQIESIMYQYKNPEKPGEDDLDHVGTTAQSLEKTDLFGDTVSENEEGIKQVDKWRLSESITAAMAELQREIDELSNNIEENQ